MPLSFRHELDRLTNAARRIDARTAVILLYSALAVILQMNLGNRAFFRADIAPLLGLEEPGVWQWVWWFSVQGFLGFVIPFVILRFGFKARLAEIGLGKGDARFAWIVAGLYVPLVVVGTWFLSADSAFLADYPHYAPAARDWSIFLIYQAFFLFYWIGWEYLWRGFVLFGTARTFGLYAILIQAVPFAILHFNKPMPEALLSIVGGVALGALCWRARSFWIAVPIHAAQMLILDLWCSLRIRTGVMDVGLSALWRVLSGG